MKADKEVLDKEVFTYQGDTGNASKVVRELSARSEAGLKGVDQQD